MKVAINGFGRIGRNFFRAAKRNNAGFDMVAVNDLTDADTLAHLLRYDTVHGRYDGTVEVVDGDLIVDGDRFEVYSRAGSRRAAVGRPRRRCRHRVDRHLPHPRSRLEAHRSRRQVGPDQRPVQATPTFRSCSA